MICDPNFKIMDIVAKWPGSVHDSRIFRESDVCGRFERGTVQFLLRLYKKMSAHDIMLLNPYNAGTRFIPDSK